MSSRRHTLGPDAALGSGGPARGWAGHHDFLGFFDAMRDVMYTSSNTPPQLAAFLSGYRAGRSGWISRSPLAIWNRRRNWSVHRRGLDFQG